MASGGRTEDMSEGGHLLGRKRFFAATFFVGLLLLWAPCLLAGLGNGKLQIHHIDVGQADGALIISPQGQTALVDDGSYSNCAPFVNYVKGLGITSIDYHFASHYHSDHIGCLDDLLASSVVLNIAGYDRGYSYTTTMYQAYVTALGSKRQTMAKNQVVTLDAGSANPVYIKCVDLNGAGVYSVTGSDENPKTMVLKITYGNFSEVMGGDLTASPSVEPTVGPEVGDVEVYKVHHHGSATSTYDAWLNATTPEVAVVSLGNGNSYGHPTAAVMTRLHNHNVKTYWTETGTGATPVPGWDKVGGTIIIEANPQPGAAYTVRGNGFVDTYYNHGQADITPPQVTVVKPNGGEVFYSGATDTIRWTATDNVGVDSVNIYYSTNSGATFPNTIATREHNDGVFVWTIPGTLSNNCKVKVVAYDQALNQGNDTSDNVFAIAPPPDVVPPQVALVEPNGGEVFYSGSVDTVRWIATDNIGVDSVSIYYSTDGGSSFPYIVVTGQQNDSSYVWTIPDTPSESCLVKVVAYDTSLNSAQAVSDSAFVISNPLGANPVPEMARFDLLQNYPNPFNPVTNLEFILDEQSRVSMVIYDISGKVIRSMVNETRSSGRHVVIWNGQDDYEKPVASGIYVCRLEAQGKAAMRKIVLLR